MNRLLTPAEAAEHLGLTSPRRVHALIHAGELPAVNVGSTEHKNNRRYRVPLVEADRWLKSRRTA